MTRPNITRFRLHLNATIEPEPIVVRLKRRCNDVLDVTTELLTVPCLRVFPTTGTDVFMLQMLDHGVEKFAPANGDGIIVTSDALARMLDNVR